MLDMLRSRSKDDASKRAIVEYMTHTTKSIRYTENRIQGLMDEIRTLLSEFGPSNHTFEAILSKIVPQAFEKECIQLYYNSLLRRGLVSPL